MLRKPPIGKSLAEVNPELAKQWHPTKNGNLSPEDVTAGSGKKVWWKCNVAVDHEWEASIGNRDKGRGCAVCRGFKVVKSNCLATTHPDLTKEWYIERNGELTPYDVISGSRTKAWWKCNKGDDHIWVAKIKDRERSPGCPICSGKRVVKSSSFGSLDPEMALLWDDDKNGDLTPFDVSPGSGKRVWWKCPKGDDHKWEATIAKRKGRRRCPICVGQKIVLSNCLGTLNPNLSLEWHPTKNGDLTPFDIAPLTHRKVWWKCSKGDDHIWEAQVANRANGRGCPICRGLKVIESNSLLVVRPEIAKEWHPTKNGKLSPEDVSASSGKKIWWKCPKGEDHEWQATIDNRYNGQGCAICSGKKVVSSNCLAIVRPEIAKEWHQKKNGDLTPSDVTISSGKKVWWKCPNGPEHEWKTMIAHRTNLEDRLSTSCPYCTLTPQSKQELIITFELSKLFPDIDPKGLKTKLNGKMHSVDIYIPSLNIGIEFDGNYWHKDKRELDKVKTIRLENAGFNIIRIREEPLKKIFNTDIISNQPYNGKEITDNLLKQIMSSYKLDKKIVTKIEKYLLKDVLQNHKALDKYIDKILEQKAKNKNTLQQQL